MAGLAAVAKRKGAGRLVLTPLPHPTERPAAGKRPWPQHAPFLTAIGHRLPGAGLVARVYNLMAEAREIKAKGGTECASGSSSPALSTPSSRNSRAPAMGLNPARVERLGSKTDSPQEQDRFEPSVPLGTCPACAGSRGRAYERCCRATPTSYVTQLRGRARRSKIHSRRLRAGRNGAKAVGCR